MGGGPWRKSLTMPKSCTKSDPHIPHGVAPCLRRLQWRRGRLRQWQRSQRYVFAVLWWLDCALTSVAAGPGAISGREGRLERPRRELPASARARSSDTASVHVQHQSKRHHDLESLLPQRRGVQRGKCGRYPENQGRSASAVTHRLGTSSLNHKKRYRTRQTTRSTLTFALEISGARRRGQRCRRVGKDEQGWRKDVRS